MKKPLRIPDLQARKARGEKITMLTAYSAWMARLLAESGAVDLLLVGDSLGMVELGYDTTLPVTMQDMLRHTRAVRAGAPHALVVADMPFLSHQASLTQGLRNAGRLMRCGASAVKLEGGQGISPTVEKLVSAGIPVMGHIGLQPQFIHAQGGFRRQATRPGEERQLLADAAALESAGAFAVVLECVPDEAAAQVSSALRVPVIGIGSGPHCDGQVLVTHDLLGLTGSAAPSFVKQYAALGQTIRAAVDSYAAEVRSGAFPPSRKRQEKDA
ncbi:MAG: 3-methyl-2-oxobutanoate hydroxymethyltransferase [Candidatus Solibacter usitatus]|nr:3-methyl-2-oxobutanoate hydroxymethyltransferase [Candidatus Solibacter usitatus]